MLYEVITHLVAVQLAIDPHGLLNGADHLIQFGGVQYGTMGDIQRLGHQHGTQGGAKQDTRQFRSGVANFPQHTELTFKAAQGGDDNGIELV